MISKKTPNVNQLELKGNSKITISPFSMCHACTKTQAFSPNHRTTSSQAAILLGATQLILW